jgi:hypothetical protein
MAIMATAKIICHAPTPQGECKQTLYDGAGDMAALLNIAEFQGWKPAAGGGWLCPEHAPKSTASDIASN